jgi:UDPglucose 6-dehydrogenase
LYYTPGMKLAVVGTGHVGLVSCVAFSSLGHEVVGTDVDEERIRQLQSGVSPFHEPGLSEALTAELASGRLTFTTSLPAAASGAEVAFICVGTPPRIDGTANLLAVEQSALALARHAQGDLVIAEKSTVPAGTATKLRPILARERPDVRFEVVSNPEFLREGTALNDFLYPARLLVGSNSELGFSAMRTIYRRLVDRGVPLIETDVLTAELAKLACNAFLALKISYVNGLARLCERAEGDVALISKVMGMDPRIGSAFLGAGMGYGGSCFPKDIAAFERLASSLGYEFPLLGEVARLNEEALEAVDRRIEEALWNLEGKTIALLGLAYKPDTDDVRFSPALGLAGRLLDKGARVVGYDPAAAHNAKAQEPRLEVRDDVYAALEAAHCAVICTEWSEIRRLNLGRARDVMTYPIIVDGRNALDPTALAGSGFTYFPTGRPAIQPENIATLET